MRSMTIYAALAIAALTCGVAAAAGVRPATLAVTVHVVKSVPVVRLVDAHGNAMTHAAMAAAVNTKAEKSVLYLIVEY